MKTRKIVTIAIFASLATVLSIVESFIPLGIPSVKLGLANIATLIILYKYSSKEAFIVQILRIFLVGLLYSGIFSISFVISLISGIISLFVMILLKMAVNNKIFTVSIVSSIAHSVTELLISLVLLKSSSVLLYLPIVVLASVLTGIITAIVSKLSLKSFNIDTMYPKLIPSIISCSFLALLVTLTIIQANYSKNNNEGSIAVVTYNNEVELKISLENPSDYTLYNDSLIDYNIEDNHYYYTFNVYNNEEKKYFNLVVEVFDEKIRIKENVCTNHTCINRGFIKNKYESIICLPNNFIITIEDYELDEIDMII